MIEEDNKFKVPDNKDQKIWRYLDFTKFVDLLDSSSLHFTRGDKFQDKFEGSITTPTEIKRDKILKEIMEQTNSRFNEVRTDIEKEHPLIVNQYKNLQKGFRLITAINCWHMNDYESAAMWKLYLKSNEGLCIQSTYTRLINTMDDTGVKIMAGLVDYKDYNMDELEIGNMMAPLLTKRKSFKHEEELRLIVMSYDLFKTPNETPIFPETGQKIRIDLTKLIENVYVSPDTRGWFTNLVKNVVTKYGYDFTVKNSGLSGDPIY